MSVRHIFTLYLTFNFTDVVSNHFYTSDLRVCVYDDRSSMNFDSLDINTAAKTEFAMFSGSASSSTDEQKQDAETYKSLSINLFESSLV